MRFLLAALLFSNLVIAQKDSGSVMDTPSPAFATDPASPASLTGPQVYALAEGSVFKLVTRLPGANADREHGTAFAIQADGYMITNYHVVATAMNEPDKYELVLLAPAGAAPARVISVDPVNDIALIKAETKFNKVLAIAGGQNAANGETIFSLGFPKSEQITMIQGTFNGERRMGFAPVLTASMPLNPGMSGGPALNARGEVIGVNRAMMVQAQNISYLSPWEALNKIAAQAGQGVKRSLASTEWRREILNDIANQESRALNERSTKRDRQKIGTVSFAVPLPNMQCGQDDLDKLGRGKREFILCQTVSLALVGPGTESLQVSTVATQSDSTFAPDKAFSALEAKYSEAKSARPSMRAKDRDLAGLTSMVKHLLGDNQKCSARNVRNRHGVGMRVRYCSVAIPDFTGLYSTFVKIDIPGKKSTSIAQSFEGLTLNTTGRLLAEFLDSVRMEAGG